VHTVGTATHVAMPERVRNDPPPERPHGGPPPREGASHYCWNLPTGPVECQGIRTGPDVKEDQININGVTPPDACGVQRGGREEQPHAIPKGTRRNDGPRDGKAQSRGNEELKPRRRKSDAAPPAKTPVWNKASRAH